MSEYPPIPEMFRNESKENKTTPIFSRDEWMGALTEEINGLDEGDISRLIFLRNTILIDCRSILMQDHYTGDNSQDVDVIRRHNIAQDIERFLQRSLSEPEIKFIERSYAMNGAHYGILYSLKDMPLDDAARKFIAHCPLAVRSIVQGINCALELKEK